MKRWLSLLALLSLTSACSYLSHRHPTETVAQLCGEHRYLTALKQLDAQHAHDADYARQRDTVIADARRYQSEVLDNARQLLQQERFSTAQQLLETASAELPPAPELEQFAEQLHTERDRYIQRHLDDLIRWRAMRLVREHSLYLALQQAATDPELKQAIARHQQDVAYFSPLIAKAGLQALDQGEYTRALQYLGVANLLTPSPELAQQLKAAEQAAATSRQKQKIARSTERERRYRDLSYALQQSLDQRDFLAARDQLEQARGLGIHADELDAAQKQLDDAINVFVTQHINSGDRHYADGRIEEALQHWRQAELLRPTPELKEKIEKAQKFIGRLHQLQKAPAKTKSQKNIAPAPATK